MYRSYGMYVGRYVCTWYVCTYVRRHLVLSTKYAKYTEHILQISFINYWPKRTLLKKGMLLELNRKTPAASLTHRKQDLGTLIHIEMPFTFLFIFCIIPYWSYMGYYISIVLPLRLIPSLVNNDDQYSNHIYAQMLKVKRCFSKM